MLIDIDDETIDKIFKNTLIQDYRILLSQKQELSSKLSRESLEQYELADLNDTEYFIKSMEVMMEYYIGDDWKIKLDLFVPV
jgi:molybdopterin-binding protein